MINYNKYINEYIDEISHVPIVVYGDKGIISYYNKAFEDLFEMGVNLIGKNINDFVKVLYESKHKAYKDTKPVYDIKAHYESREGSKIDLDGLKIIHAKDIVVVIEKHMLYESSIVEELSKVNMDLASLSRELTKKNRELNIANEKIRQLTFRDYLTGCYNRRYFYSRLKEMVALCNRKDYIAFGVISIDIDFFKIYNDHYGHDMGDRVLKNISDNIMTQIRKEDIFARLGGDEFSVLVHTNSIKDLSEMADKIRDITNKLVISGLEEKVTLSIGATMFRPKEDETSLMKRADDYLYEIKKMGRNQVKCL